MRIGKSAVLTTLTVGLTIFLTLSNRYALAQSPQVTASIERVLATEPTARVIVALHSPEMGTEVTVQAQQIARTQNDILSDLSTEDFHLIHKYKALPGLAGEVTKEGLAALLERPEVEAVALDMPVEAVLTESAALINADDVWRDFGFTGSGVNVAVLDTGVDTTHPDLSSNIIAQHCFNHHNCPPDNAQESGSAQDENGHGTQVAGIIAGQGQISPQGIAAGAGIVAVRVLGSNGSGFTSDVLAGLDWVAANQSSLNIKVINLSLGSGSYSGVCNQADANTMLYAVAVERVRQSGITIFAASGNGGKTEEMMSPACISGVVSIGNVHDSDLSSINWPACGNEPIVADQVACSSNSSTALDLLAPGVLIRSAGLGGEQGSGSGTSLSTAHASAVTALVLQANPNLTPAEIKTILKETGTPVTDNRNGRVTPRIDALAAVMQVIGDEITVISGTVLLQGRADHSDTTIFLSQEPCSTTIPDAPVVTTEADGNFKILRSATESYQCLQAVQSGYLVGWYDSPKEDLGAITLPGGDVTKDGLINIFDLALIASYYQSDNPAADINASGLVDIFDLVIVANNYHQKGPVNDWK